MRKIRIVEVGPRDGLQNEQVSIPLETKLAFISRLRDCGLREIEATSFVSPKWVPQLSDAAELWPRLPEGPLYSALVPNLKGLERAMSLGVKRIALFTAASDAFTRNNINMTIAESLDVYGEMITQFRAGSGPDAWVRGYVSTAFECPFSGRVPIHRVLEVCDALLKLGVNEVCLGDTIGVAVPEEVRALGREIANSVGVKGPEPFAWHFHDTRGTALANVVAALDFGFSVFDSSAGGLGGCPYAPGAGGNLATEDLIYLLSRSGFELGIDLDLLAKASLPVLELLGRAPSARAQLAVLSR